MGLILHPGSYLREVWNVMDATVVICALVSFIFDLTWVWVGRSGYCILAVGAVLSWQCGASTRRYPWTCLWSVALLCRLERASDVMQLAPDATRLNAQHSYGHSSAKQLPSNCCLLLTGYAYLIVIVWNIAKTISHGKVMISFPIFVSCGYLAFRETTKDLP